MDSPELRVNHWGIAILDRPGFTCLYAVCHGFRSQSDAGSDSARRLAESPVSRGQVQCDDQTRSCRKCLTCYRPAFFGTRGRRCRAELYARRTRNAAPAASRPNLVAGSLSRPANSLPQSGHREPRVRTDRPQLRHAKAGGRGRRPTTRNVRIKPNGPRKKPTQNHNQKRLP